MAVEDARAEEKCLACLLAKKWHRYYSEMVQFVSSWMSLEVVSSNTLLLKMYQANQVLLGQRTVWDDGAGSGLASY